MSSARCTCHYTEPEQCPAWWHTTHPRAGQVLGRRQSRGQGRMGMADHPTWNCQRDHEPSSWMCCPCDHGYSGCCWHLPELEQHVHDRHICVPYTEEVKMARGEDDASRDKESIKATIAAMLELPYYIEKPREAVASLARIFLDDEDLIALAGGDPLPDKMAKARRLRP